MLVFRIEPSAEAVLKGASLSPQELFDSGAWDFVKAKPEELDDDEKEVGKALEAEELDYFLSLNKSSRQRFIELRKSNPDSPVVEEEEVAVEVASPDGSVTQVAAVKPAGEAVTVATPEVEVSSAPAGTQTAVTKAAGDAWDGIREAAAMQPIYKSADGRLFYNEESASVAKELDELKAKEKKKDEEDKMEKAFMALPNVPRSIVKACVHGGGGEDVVKELTSLNSRLGVLGKQFGSPVDDTSGASVFEGMVADRMRKDSVGYSKAVTEVMKTDAGREAYQAEHGGQIN